MSPTVCLFALTILTAADPPEPPLASPPVGAPPASVTAPRVTPAPLPYPPAPTEEPAPPLRLRDRIRNWFNRRREEPKEAAGAPVVLDQSGNAFPPGSSTAPPRPLAPTLRPMDRLTPRPAVAGEFGDLDKCGHEQDYSWITGRLARDGNRWIIRYAGPNEIDRFGGRLPLAGNLDPSKLQEGALVCVLGQVVGGRGSPVYQVQQINLIEPARR